MPVYPDPPGPRMAYDIDGSVMWVVDQTSLAGSLLSQAAMSALNDDSFSTTGITFSDSPFSQYVLLFFPQLRDLAGVFHATNRTAIGAMHVSSNATSPTDGTWTQVFASTPVWDGSAQSGTMPYRTAILTAAQSNVKAIRWTMSGGFNAGTPVWRTMHLYGSVSVTGHTLAFWDPVLNQPMSSFNIVDFPDVPQGSTQSIQMRVKNLSNTFTATSVVISSESISDSTDAVWTFSQDNVTFTTTTTIASIAPGAISAPFYVREVVPTTAALGLRSLRLRTSTLLWT